MNLKKWACALSLVCLSAFAFPGQLTALTLEEKKALLAFCDSLEQSRQQLIKQSENLKIALGGSEAQVKELKAQLETLGQTSKDLEAGFRRIESEKNLWEFLAICGTVLGIGGIAWGVLHK